MLTSKQRSMIKSAAVGIPDTQMGKAGITDNMVEAVKKDLLAREIVKVSVLKNAGTPTMYAGKLAEKTQSELVCIIGSKFILYKKSPKMKIHITDTEEDILRKTMEANRKNNSNKSLNYANKAERKMSRKERSEMEHSRDNKPTRGAKPQGNKPNAKGEGKAIVFAKKPTSPRTDTRTISKPRANKNNDK